MKRISVINKGEEILFTLDEWLGFCITYDYTWFGMPHNWVEAIQSGTKLPTSHLIIPSIRDNGYLHSFPITFEELEAEFKGDKI